MYFLRLIAAASAVVFALTGMAQTNAVQDWMSNGRPEHIGGEQGHASDVRAPWKAASQNSAPLKARGVQRIPVVLSAFSDIPFSAAETDEAVNAFYNDFCNGSLFTGHGSHGSIRDYFIEQSDSVFLPEFVIIGPITLDNPVAYYGSNSGTRKDTKYTEFANESIRKAMEVYTQWEDFDNDGNGSVDMVFFIYAGLGESNTLGKYPNLLWPKEFTSNTTINGKVFATAGLTCEARPKTWNDDYTEVLESQTDGVGVFIHELSHALGLPDFYDTNNKAFGMDLWSVMDYGEYGNNGYNPGNYTAYERDFMGWRRLIELKEPCVLTIPCFADGGYGYKIVNEANANEYYVIENRQAKGWDDMVCTLGHGLQVTHVDYLASRWSSNTVNTDASHQRMTIIAANNTYRGTNSASSGAEWRNTLSGNLYPGASDNHALTDETTPAAKVFTGGYMGKALRNITENADGTVTVCFRTNGKLAVPVMEPAVAEMDEITLAWGTVENATQYAVEIYKDGELLVTDTVETLSFHVGELPMGTYYSYRVKAMADSPEDYIESEWTDMEDVHTLSPVTITANDLVMVYGDEVPDLTCTADGDDYQGEPELQCDVTPATPVGTYEIAVQPGSIATHNITYVSGTLTVQPAPLVITAEDAEREQGKENPDFTARYEGFKNGEDASVLITQPMFSCLAVPESPVGTYEIEAYGAEAQNYDISYVTGKLTVTTPDAVATIPDSDCEVDIFTTSGVLVSHCKGNEVGRLYLRRGIYVVRSADGTARRVLVR